jgi:hypothetical protein
MECLCAYGREWIASGGPIVSNRYRGGSVLVLEGIHGPTFEGVCVVLNIVGGWFLELVSGDLHTAVPTVL